MKTYRLITLVAALLITALEARVFIGEKLGASPDPAPAAIAVAQ